MGIFSRFRDIANSNLNSMLEKAEDPEKLIRMMIAEMEDTLVEVKAAAANVMATHKRIEQELEHNQVASQRWQEKAKLAVDKGREDLAREALKERQFNLKQQQIHERELLEFESLIKQYNDDMRQLEDKLTEAQEKHRVLVQRHIHALGKKRLQSQIHKATSTDAFTRYSQLEHRVDRMEVESDLSNLARISSLEDQFEELQEDETIEKELAKLRSKKKSPVVETEKPVSR